LVSAALLLLLILEIDLTSARPCMIPVNKVYIS